jgi:diacylglycerol O-acyltransferase
LAPESQAKAFREDRMERLSALDASFLYGETPETPMHVAGLGIFDKAPEGTNVFEAFRDHIRARLHLLPFFHRKLALSPIQLDHPVWIEDDAVDFDYHIRHMALPKPGTGEQLRTLVARLHMILLDRSRPLWQYYVIEGLQGGGFAVYLKMHHAGIDGGAGMASLETIFSDSPEPSVVPPPPPPRKKEATPNIFELISSSYSNFFNQQRQFYESWPDISKAIANVSQRLTENLSEPSPFALAPKTIFNVTLSNQRSFATGTIPLGDVKALGKLLGAKINDIVLTVCAGALRRYLLKRNSLPDESLVAAVPVSLRKEGNTDMNNQVTAMLCKLATDVADPVERLQAIVASSNVSKERLGVVKDVIPTDISWLGAPIVLTGMARLFGRGNIAETMPPVMNVLISNVPGPRKPLYCAGTEMLAYFPVSIPAHGGVLNITVQSYVDRLDFGLIACKAAVPDIDKLMGYLIYEFEALKAAADKRQKTEKSDPSEKGEKNARSGKKPRTAATAA